MAATRAHRPDGPIDPLAAQIAGFFAQDPGWQALASAPLEPLRAALRAANPVTGAPAVTHVSDHAVPVRGGAIEARLYRPAPATPALLVWAHGGGFALGSVDESDVFVRTLANASGAAILSVGYRLAPEHPFPTAVEDMEAAVAWAAERVAELAGGPAVLLAGGDSAGASLATVVTWRLHRDRRCAVAGNILAYPNTDAPDAASLTRFAAPFLTAADVAFFLTTYQPDAAGHDHPDFAPLSAGDLHLLPPTLLLTAEHDIITEQAETYGDRLAAAGVTVRRRRYPGMIHGFLTLEPFFAGAAGAAMRDIAEFISVVAARDLPILAGEDA